MATQTVNPLLFSLQDEPFGISWKNWIEEWFHWFYSTDEETTHKDTGDVVFLTSIHDINNERIKQVNCTIKQDKAILLSVSKWIEFGLPFMNTKKMLDSAKERIDTLEKMTVFLDDVSLKPERIVTHEFQINVERDLPPVNTGYSKLIKKGKYKAVAEGHWLFIKPNQLEKGEHEIHTFASCATGVVTLDVNHELNII